MHVPPKAVWSDVEDEWTMQVASRKAAPAQADIASSARATAQCPFCPGGTEFPGPFTMELVPSRFPAVVPDVDLTENQAHGQQFVLVYTPDHEGEMARQSRDHVSDLLRRIGHVTDGMLESPSIQTVFTFEVRGDHFGPTVAHPHTQILGLSFVPRRVTTSATQCRYCRRPSPDARVATVGTAQIAVPEYARFPFEMVLTPTRHVGLLSMLTNEEAFDLAGAILTALRLCRMPEENITAPYIFAVMQAPKGHQAQHHVRIEILPLHRPGGGLKRPGGLEVAAGIFINPVPPSEAAELLKDLL